MKLNMIDKVIKKLIGMLEGVEKLINTLPTKEENTRVRSPVMNAKVWKKNESKKAPVNKTSNRTTSKRKGKRDSATQMFNHPKRDFHT